MQDVLVDGFHKTFQFQFHLTYHSNNFDTV